MQTTPNTNHLYQQRGKSKLKHYWGCTVWEFWKKNDKPSGTESKHKENSITRFTGTFKRFTETTQQKQTCDKRKLELGHPQTKISALLEEKTKNKPKDLFQEDLSKNRTSRGKLFCLPGLESRELIDKILIKPPYMPNMEEDFKPYSGESPSSAKRQLWT